MNLAVVPILPSLQALATLLPLLAISTMVAVFSLFRPRFIGQVARFCWSQKLPIGLLMLLVATPVLSMRLLVPGWSKGDRKTGVHSQWLMHRGGPLRHGTIEDKPGPIEGGVRWSFGPPGSSFFASACVVDSRVYTVGTRGNRGRIYCLDAVSGTLQWSSSPKGYRGTFSSPVATRELLICGEGVHQTTDARLVAVDLRQDRMGQIAWTFPTNGHIECTPCVDGDRVYFGAGDDGIYCLEFDTNAATVVWHASGKDFPDAETSLIVHEGRVYMGLGIGGEAVCVLDASNGKQLARLKMPYPVFSPPAISNGKLYVGMGVGNYVTPANRPAGRVSCIDLATLTVDWHRELGGTILGAPLIQDNHLIVGCADGFVYLLDSRSGSEQSKFDSHAAIVSSPATDGKRVYLINEAGTLLGLDIESLEPVWHHSFLSGGRFVSSPSLGDGGLFVGTEFDGLCRLGQGRDAERTESWRSSTARWPGNPRGHPLARSAQMVWAYSGKPDDDDDWVVRGRMAAVGDHLLVPVAQRTGGGLARLELTRSSASLDWWRESDGLSSEPLAVVDDRAFVVESTEDDSRCNLLAIDFSTGNLIWQHEISPQSSRSVFVDLRGIVIQDQPAQLSRLDLDGKRVWSIEMARVAEPAWVSSSMVFTATIEPPLLLAMDWQTGRNLWKVELDDKPLRPLLRNREIVLATVAGVRKYSAIDGRLLDRDLSSSRYERGMLTPDWCLLESGKLLTIDHLSDGRVTAALPQVLDVDPLLAPNAILFSSAAGLKRMDAMTYDVSPWCEEQLPGAPTSPVTLHQGRYYLGVAGHGVVCLSNEQP